MKNFLVGVLATVAITVVGASIYIFSGAFDIAADSPHNALTFSIIETVRDRAIDSRAAEVTVPTNLADAERVRRGSGNYDEMCVSCHLKPGMDNSEIRKGLYPEPPDLTEADKDEDSAKVQFWVIKHGIKASGMAAWSKGGMGDEDIWDLVAFLQKMPTLSADDYTALVASSGGHSHQGVAAHHDSLDDDMAEPAQHDHGAHKH